MLQLTGTTFVAVADAMHRISKSEGTRPKAMASFDMVSAILNFASAMASIGQPTELQVILKACRLIQDDIHELRLEMRSHFELLREEQRLRFQAVHNHLSAIYSALDDKLSAIHKDLKFGMSDIRQQLANIVIETNGQIEKAQRVVQDILSEKNGGWQ